MIWHGEGQACASGSEKAWRLLSDDHTIFKLYIAVAVLTPVERILHQQFEWQSSSAWLSPDLAEVPFVKMANMQNSPAMRSIHHLARCLMGCNPLGEQDEVSNTILKTFDHLHRSSLDVLPAVSSKQKSCFFLLVPMIPNSTASFSWWARQLTIPSPVIMQVVWSRDGRPSG